MKGRIIVFAESGLLAGDLAAWLSARFLVERVTSLPGARIALQKGAGALIILDNSAFLDSAGFQELVEAGRQSRCRILLMGIDPSSCPDSWRDQVFFMDPVPAPAQVIAALKDLPPARAQSGS